MTLQGIPSDVETLVQLCCSPWSSTGAGSVADNGPNSYVYGSAAGLYQVVATVPYDCTDFASGITEVSEPDDATDMNNAAATSLPWGINESTGPSFAFLTIGGDPSVIFSRFVGIARHTVSLELTGGTPGESCRIWIRKNGGLDLKGSAVVVFGADGRGSGTLVAMDPGAAALDSYQVFGQSTGAPTTPAFADLTRSFWLAERLTPPTVDATLSIYDSSDALLYSLDTDSVIGYQGTVRLAAQVMLPDHGRVKVFIRHNFGESYLEAASETHVDLVYLAPPATIHACPNEGGGCCGG